MQMIRLFSFHLNLKGHSEASGTVKFIQPMIVSQGEEVFDDDDYLFEPKWDGYRLQLHKRGQRLEAYTRSGENVTEKLPELHAAVSCIKANEAVLDCEAICLQEGRPVFDDMAYRMRLRLPMKVSQAVRTHPVTFVAFDLLRLNEESLMHCSLIERKQRLSRVIELCPALVATMFVEGQGTAMSRLTRDQGLEGLVAKKKHSLYHPGVVSADWLKFKHERSLDTLVLGYREEPRFALIVGVHFRTVRNKPVATVERGISAEDKERFLTMAAGLPTRKENGVHWLEPRMCCRITYRDRNDRHQLGMTEFKQFLPEKPPEECVWSYK
ncbi:DNA ligase [Paenibacillus sp. GD4]|uniref:ATP-dependent DNA ligase n=1 Tax=Paenibacillus sp. GD4 TaxID=3068890 RepID=UPI0027969EC8|nr:DNA ligase [Paenibacillus sp. GD4]MDQ1909080.1 DNA ligase [Paenibacillus sp. GD4]